MTAATMRSTAVACALAVLTMAASQTPSPRVTVEMNLGELPNTPANRETFQKSMAAMEAAERLLFPAR